MSMHVEEVEVEGEEAEVVVVGLEVVVLEEAFLVAEAVVVELVLVPVVVMGGVKEEDSTALRSHRRLKKQQQWEWVCMPGTRYCDKKRLGLYQE